MMPQTLLWIETNCVQQKRLIRKFRLRKLYTQMSSKCWRFTSVPGEDKTLNDATLHLRIQKSSKEEDSNLENNPSLIKNQRSRILFSSKCQKAAGASPPRSLPGSGWLGYFYASMLATVAARGIMFSSVHPSVPLPSQYFRSALRDLFFFRFGTNVLFDSRFSWKYFGGQGFRCN